MKIVTWNINGLRSLKKGVESILVDLQGDIICFQETKISRSMLPEDTALVKGYSSYFTFPKKVSGYSGVATYCNSSCTPVEAKEGLANFVRADGKYEEFNKILKTTDLIEASDLQALDSEGRTLISWHEFKHNGKTEVVAVINVYCPCVDPEKPERQKYKMQFCHLLEARARSFYNEGCHVIILGDLNIAHRTIDHCDPCDEKEFNAKDSRKWLTSLVEPSSDSETAFMIDAYRHLHPDQREAYTCWNTLTGARQTNYGTRIDYILISLKLLPFLTSCEILSEIHGSDHCPVSVVLDFETIPASTCSALCTRNWLEFAGKQQKLSSFLQKRSNTNSVNSVLELKHKSQIESSDVSKRRKLSTKQNEQKAITNFFRSNSIASKKVPNDFVSEQTRPIKTEITVAVHSEQIGNEVSSVQNGENLPCDEAETEQINKAKQSDIWKSVLCGPPKAPLCKGHSKPCVLRTVRKDGPNFGRQFFACPQPNGHASNPESRCDFFQWATAAKRTATKSS